MTPAEMAARYPDAAAVAETLAHLEQTDARLAAARAHLTRARIILEAGHLAHARGPLAESYLILESAASSTAAAHRTAQRATEATYPLSPDPADLEARPIPATCRACEKRPAGARDPLSPYCAPCDPNGARHAADLAAEMEP